MNPSQKPSRPPTFYRQNSQTGGHSPAMSFSGEGPPLRPERSMRRPINSPSPATLAHGIPDGRFPDSLDRLGNVGQGVGLGVTDKSRRMMDQLNYSMSSSTGSRLSPNDSPLLTPAAAAGMPSGSRGQGRRNSHDSASSTSSSRPASPQPEEVATPPTAALNSAISAFSSAGQRRDGRRGGLADQGYETKVVRKAVSHNANEFPDTPAFREVVSVLHHVKTDWPVLMYGATGADEGGQGGDDGDKEFDPVSLALGLLDPSSSGTANSLSSFMRMKAELDHAITSTLSSNKAEYRAYESSITTYNATLSSLSSSQKQVAGLRKRLIDARERLEGKGREGLVGMYNRASHLEEMLKILDEIDHLRSVPDRLEALMSDKRFLSAVILLVRSLKTINKPEMMEIGALSDLRSWLVLQEGVLLEILIEELHNHLYLKSFYCDARWKAYTRGQSTLPLVDFGEDLDTLQPVSHLEASFHSAGRSTARLPRLSKLQRYLNGLSLQSSHNPLLDEPIDDITLETAATEDNGASMYDGFGSFSLPSLEAAESTKSKSAPHKNAEVDSFLYIESLMESLACFGKLGYGLDAVNQRVQAEMFNLVDTTIEEVEERNDPKQTATNRPSSLAGGQLGSLSTFSLHHSSTNRSALLRLTASETNELELSVETLKDLFWTLFSKLDAVLQGFRVSYEVAMRITERRDFKDSSNIKTASGNLMFSLIEIWKPVQQEVRALLHDYLADDHTGTVTSRNPIVSVNEVLRLARPRDNSKQIFKFAESDIKASTKALKSHEDELNRALKTAVPGLITDGSTGIGQLAVSSVLTDDRYGAGRTGPGGTHKALVQADAFNVSILFEPTWAFLERVRTIMPDGLLGEDDAGGFGGFLDEFVLRTFLPQLEEKVSSVFHQAVGGHEAFQEDPNYKKVSAVPIIKSVTNLMLLISSLCSMLRATPFHRENYSHLIVSVIHQFYQRCQERFKDLTAREHIEPPPVAKGEKSMPRPPPQRLSATWADLPDLNKAMLELRGIPVIEKAKIRECLMKETKVELDKKGIHQIAAEDLISPSKKLVALGTLYSSLDWFIIQVSSLGGSAASGDGASAVPADEGTPTIPDTPRMGGDEEGDESRRPALPLTQEMTQPFEGLLRSYRKLANLVLFTIRLEIRLRTMHHLDKATRDGVYQLAEDTAEPDPSVVDLNSDLAECDECAATTLAEPERQFVFEGLSLLMDQLLVNNSRYIRLANKFGLSKMMRNILALQQNLKNIGDSPLDVDFDRSRKFWEVFGAGPKVMMDMIRSGEIAYDFEEYKSLLNLQCGIDQSSKDHEITDSAAPLSASGDKSRRHYNELLIELFSCTSEVDL